MPFRSKAQLRWMFANHPRIARRWAKHTPDIKSLPERVDSKESSGTENAESQQRPSAEHKKEAFSQAARWAFQGYKAAVVPRDAAASLAAMQFAADLAQAQRPRLRELLKQAAVPTVSPQAWTPRTVAEAQRILAQFLPQQRPQPGIPPAVAARRRPRLSGPGSQALRLPNVIGAFGPLGGNNITNGGQSVRANYRWA